MPRLQFLKKHIKKGKILDIGNLGGDGKMHKRIREAFPECEIFGIDKDKQKAEELKFSNQIIGNVDEVLPYENNFFDTVYLGELIEHTWYPKKVLEETYRVLIKEGVVILDTPNIYALKRATKFFLTGKDSLGDSDHKILFIPATLKNLLEKCGFDIIEITTDRKFNIKNINLSLPDIAPFKWLGSHLCIAAKK